MFVENPNLPKGEVTAVAVSEDAHETIYKLNSLGINTYKIKRSDNLPEPVSSHADLQLLHLGKDILFLSDEHLFSGESDKKFKIRRIGAVLGKKYPDDVILNCKIIGNKIFLNKKTIADEILEFAYYNDMTVINVNQGYTGCSICAVHENAIITDDKSIYRAAGNLLNDVLFISKGSIRLKGYGYGFIGGCCGKLSSDKLAVNGRIESHDDYNKIIDFTAKHNIEIIELTDKQLTDIGGILPLTEKD